MQGVNALRYPEVAAALSYSLEQREKLSPIFKQANQLQAFVGNSLGDRLKAEALEVLTPEQRQKFENMKGEPLYPLGR